jgi:hypothetical protein
MTYEIVFTIRAHDTFASIKSQIDNRWGKKSVIDFEQRTSRILDVISHSPFVYNAIPLNRNIRKGFIHLNCSMFYEVKEQSIEILFFWDNRQDPIFL